MLTMVRSLWHDLSSQTSRTAYGLLFDAWQCAQVTLPFAKVKGMLLDPSESINMKRSSESPEHAHLRAEIAAYNAV
jgi:hypothetical protein